MFGITESGINIPVLNYGPGWLLVDKPAGISVHNDPGKDLQSRMRKYCEQTPLFQKRVEFDQRFGIQAVHRLDQDTSGVILLASNHKSSQFLILQFQNDDVEKRYWAVLHGAVKADGDHHKWQKWTTSLTKKAGGRKNPRGAGPKLACETRFRVLEYSQHYTLVECNPVTGRTHQIRRHASLAGHAVVGDSRYATSRSLKFLREVSGFNRLALHASSLKIKTTNNKGPIVVTSKLPQEQRMRSFIPILPTSCIIADSSRIRSSLGDRPQAFPNRNEYSVTLLE